MSGDRQRTRYYSTRPRRVPPEFCSDDVLEACSLLAALTLYRVISQADDQGRLPGSPKYIRGTCFPLRPEISTTKVAAAIDELVEAGFLIRYEVERRTLLQVDRWHDLQGKWGRRAYPSRYPAPPGWVADWVNVRDDDEQVELRALGAQRARDLHAPIPSPPPFPLSVPITGLGRPPTPPSGMERISDLIEKAKHGHLTSQDALEMGTALLDRRLSPRREA